MTDRMTTARAALEKAAKAFREYEAHHQARADEEEHRPRKLEAMGKAQRNRDLATEMEMALNLLSAQ
jgi:hypothetical protein